MVTYNAKMLSDAEDSVPGHYPFEASEELFEESADKIVRTFFQHVDKDIFHHHIDYELNAALKSKNGKAVKAMGSIIMKGGSHLPFVLLISK